MYFNNSLLNQYLLLTKFKKMVLYSSVSFCSVLRRFISFYFSESTFWSTPKQHTTSSFNNWSRIVALFISYLNGQIRRRYIVCNVFTQGVHWGESFRWTKYQHQPAPTNERTFELEKLIEKPTDRHQTNNCHNICTRQNKRQNLRYQIATLISYFFQAQKVCRTKPQLSSDVVEM